MTTVFQPPPTWELPIVLDFEKKVGLYSPVWLRWFLDLVRTFNANGTVRPAPPVIELQTVVTGFSLTPAATTDILILAGAGTLATGTVTMPGGPLDGQVFTVISNQIIQALTVAPNAGQGIYNAPICLNLSRNTPGVITGFSFSCVYAASTAYWYRLN